MPLTNNNQQQKQLQIPTPQQTQNSFVQKTPYQQNVANVQPKQNNDWFKGTYPTTSEIYGRVYQMWQKDPNAASQVMAGFSQAQQDSSSPWYNPYTQPTNRAVNVLQSYGIDTNTLTDEWFQQNTSWQQSLRYGNTTNTPLAPLKNATDDQIVAFNLYQYQYSEPTTKKAEQEWEALKQELTYKATRKDRNYSDDEIINSIDWNKYGTLKAMNDGKTKGAVTELNRAVDFSDDEMRGVLWAARNGGSTGSSVKDMAMYGLGEGNQWVDNPEMRAKLDWRDANTYSPYQVGMTVDEDVGLYFNVPYIDREVLNRLRASIDDNDETAMSMYHKAAKSVENAEKAQEQRDNLYAWIDKNIGNKSEEWLKKQLDIKLGKSDYSMLKAMDDSIDNGSSLVQMGTAVDYKKQDVLDYIHRKKIELGGANTAPDIANGTSASVKTKDQVQQEAEDILRRNRINDKAYSGNEKDAYDSVNGAGAYDRDIAAAESVSSQSQAQKDSDQYVNDTVGDIEEDLTPGEASRLNGYSGASDQAQQTIKENRDAMVSGQESPEEAIRKNTAEITKGYIEGTVDIYERTTKYEAKETDLAVAKKQLDEVNAKLGDKVYAGQTQDTSFTMEVNGDLYRVTLSPDLSEIEGIDNVNKADTPVPVYASYGLYDSPEEYDADTLVWEAVQNSGQVEAFREKYDQDAARINAANQLEITEEDNELLNRKRQLEVQIEDDEQYLRDYKNQYDADIQAYNRLAERRAAHIQNLKDMGASTTEVETADAALTALTGFTSYEPTQWDYYNPSYAYADRIAKGEDKAAVLKDAEAEHAEMLEQIKDVEWLKDYCERHNINIKGDIRNNMDRRIAKLQRDSQDYDYFRLQFADDFNQEADAQKKADEEYAEKYAATHRLNDINQVPGTLYSEFGGYDYYLTDDERNTWYYLKAKDKQNGTNKAEEYAKFMTDETYGVLMTRAAIGAEEGAKELTGAEGTLGLGFTLANLTTILLSPYNAVASGTAIANKVLSGKELNPNTSKLQAMNIRSATREQSAQEILETFGKPVTDNNGNVTGYEQTWLSKIAQGGYEIVTNRADSAINAASFGWMFGGVGNEILREIFSASPMGVGAAVEAAANAKEKGATDAQAFGVGAFTFIAETVTEGVSLENMNQAFKIGKSIGPGTYKKFLVNWLTKAGISEMVGESTNDIVENLADAVIMGELSERNEKYYQYRSEGYDKNEAWSMTLKDEVKGVLRTALISYLTPGLDVFQTIRGRMGYFTEATRKQNEENGTNLTVRQVRKQILAEQRSEQQKENQRRKEEAKDFDRELRDIDYDALEERYAPEQAKEEKAAAKTAEEEAKAKDSKQNTLDFEILETAKTYDKAGKSAAIAAVLDVGSTQEQTDTANAASVRLGDALGQETDVASEMQDVLLGAKVTNGDVSTSDVKQGFMYAALGGEQSQSRQVVQSDAYQKATPVVKATMLAEAAQQDAQNPDIMKNVANAVREDRIAKQMGVLMANGAAEKIGQAEVKVDFANLETQKAQKSLDTQRGVEKTAREKQQRLVAESVQNPQNKQMAQDADNAVRDLIDQAKVTREYEQSVKNAQQREDQAKRNAEKVRQKTLSDIRQQAEQIINQEDQQRAQQRQQAEEALRAEQERIAKENAERQAAEDQANGKVAEDERRAKIDKQIDKMGLKGEKAEQLRQKLYQFDQDIQTKKVDTSRLLSDAEAALAINSLSRKLGVQIEVGQLPEGRDGVYRSNGKIVLSDRLTVGQAMLEVAMHEITHSLEKTKSYAKYKDTVMGILFNSDAEREQAVQNKIDFYARNGVKLGETPGEARAAAEAEIVADFAKNDKTFANRATINRMIDAGLGGKIRNALHNVNQYLKNAKLSGQEKQKAEALRRAERLYTKAIEERRAMSVHPTSEQFSVNQFAQAAGLFYQDYDITDDKGKVIARQGLYTADPSVDSGAVRISKVTPEMMANTPVGNLTNAALALGTMDQETVGKIHKMFADLMTMCADIQDTNLVWEIAGATLYSEFSAIKANSDKQYSTTVDFGTICTKTQAVINQLSRNMLRLGRGLTSQEILDVYNDVYQSDLTVPCPVCYVFSRWLGVPSLLENIRQYQNRFLGENGKELTKEQIQARVDEFIKKAHADYGVGETEKEQELYRENVVKLRKKAAESVEKAEAKVHAQEQKVADYEDKLKTNPTRGDWLRNKASAERNLAKLQEELTQKRLDLENVEVEAYGKTINKKKADIEKSIKDKLVKIEGDDKGKIGINDQIRERIKEGKSYDDLVKKRTALYGEIDGLMAKLREVDAYNWVTQALCKMDEEGRFVVDDDFVRTKDEVLLDLNRTGEFAKDTKNWTYRCTRGAGMGKAILPYSGANIGDSVLGIGARRTANPYQNGDVDGAFAAMRKGIIKAKQQNLIGGQRFQSTSDFRPEWGLDYIMTFIEQQALGSNGQLYTKVNEAVPLYASVGIDTNCSIMPYADGFHYPAEGEIENMSPEEKKSRVITFKDDAGNEMTVVLDFSDVTGMRYDKAMPLSKAYDNVQMIMVGINDIHIRACLAGEEIDFVIPWHASGNTKGQLASMMSTVSETLTNSSDYTKVQTDQIAAKKELEAAHGKQERGEALTAREKDLIHKEEMRDARQKLLTGKKLTTRDIQRISESEFLTSLYERFMGKTLDGKELPHDSKYWVDLPDGKGGTTSERVTLTTGQSEQIFPYEYWDYSLKKEQADENGWRFIQYCQELGLTPRFSGGNQKNEKTGEITRFGNFAGAVYDENGEIVGYDRDRMAKGYWKTLIDRKMYDNKGNYRDQQKIDASKVQTGRIEGGKLVDSTIPAETEGATYRGEESEKKYENADRLFRSRIEEKAKAGDKQAQADLAQMQIYDDAHADIEEQYDLTGQDNPDEELTAGEMMQMLKDAGVDYEDAVAKGDMEAAREDLKFAAEQAGYTEVWAHGSRDASFTTFDLSKATGAKAVFLSDQFTASAYTDASYYPISTKLIGKEITTIDDALSEIKRIMKYAPEKVEEGYKIGLDSSPARRRIGQKDVYSEEDVIAYANGLRSEKKGGTYALFVKPGKTLNVDANNAYWNEIKSDYGRTTDQIAEWAKRHGYDSVLISNVHDGYHIESDVMIVFDGTRLKSAETVTYDDEGKVIPLDQRFSDSPDIRYSVSDSEGDLTEGEMMQLLTDAGVYGEQYSVSEPGDTVYDHDEKLVKDGILKRRQLNKMNKTDVGEGTRAWGTGMAQRMDELADQARQYVLDHSAYQRDTNKAQIDRAVSWVKQLPTQGNETTYDKAIRYVTSEAFRKGEAKTADGRAKLAVSMGMAVARNDVSAQVLIADMTNKTATNVAQALQAQKLFKLMTPEGRIGTLQRMLDDQKLQLQRRGKNAVAENLKFSDWVLRAAGVAETEAEMKQVRDAALNELAKQIPMNWKDRLTSFRMLSMLANPRTHIRNIVGNALFVPAIGIKNKLSAIAEAMMLEKGQRTKTLAPILNKSIREFARQDAVAMKDVLTGEAKYNDSGSLIGRQQKGLSKINGDFLEKEDWLFLKGHYRRALGGWMQANGYTVEDVKNDHQLLAKGREYAIEEAQKATYRDFSKTADALNKISKQGGALGFVVDAALPFKKTPINILRRGIEYSPVGIAKGLKNLMFHMNEYTQYQQQLEDYEAGKTETAPVMPDKAVSPNQVIDQLCSGLTGTGIMALGFLLAGTGAVTCSLDDDDDKFEKAKGGQEYALNLGKTANSALGLIGIPKLFGEDVTMTIDWAAPMCMPFFVGAAIRDQAEKENLDIDAMINAFSGITEPVFNLSMLDGVNTLLKTNSYDDMNSIAQIGSKLALNYAGSYVPSFLGALARTIDEKQRKAFVPGDKKGVVSNALYTHEQAQNKIPFYNQQNIAARNIWGEEKTSDFAERLIENFISPGYFNKVENDPIINEMARLYDVTGDNKMIPDEDPDKKITFTKDKVKREIVLTDKEWDEYKKVRGQTAKKELTELLNSESYQNATDAARVQMIKDIWSHADKVGKNAVTSDFEIEDKTVAQIAKDSKLTGYESEMIKALNTGDYSTYDDMAEAIRQEYDDEEEADSKIRQKLMDYYREMYKKAYRRGGEEGQVKMAEIEEALEYTGLIDDDDFMRWQAAVDKEED